MHVVKRLIRPPCHTLLPIWRCGAVHCDPGTPKLTEVYEIYPELTGEVLAHNFPGSRFQESPADDKNDFFFSAICTGIYGTKYNCVLQWMLVHRDQKRAAIAPLTKGRSWTDFCVQLTQESMLGRCRTRRPPRMGSVLVGARFTETRNGIPNNSFDASQIDSYLTMRKKTSFTLRDDLDTFWWD